MQWHLLAGFALREAWYTTVAPQDLLETEAYELQPVGNLKLKRISHGKACLVACFCSALPASAVPVSLPPSEVPTCLPASTVPASLPPSVVPACLPHFAASFCSACLLASLYNFCWFASISSTCLLNGNLSSLLRTPYRGGKMLVIDRYPRLLLSPHFELLTVVLRSLALRSWMQTLYCSSGSTTHHFAISSVEESS